MTPILFESNETTFSTNGLGRLRDCITCVVTEERNGVYECDFSYPVEGAHFSEIKCGRIIAVTHDETGSVQPFEIVSASRPLEGVVSFHAVHISYRQSGLVVAGTNIQSLADAFDLLENAQPQNPFTYWTDKPAVGYLAAADGTPRSVRQLLGGVQGSILDAYGGEYEFDGFTVRLWQNRGVTRDFAIRYGVNLLGYDDTEDYEGTYTSALAFWKNSDGEIVTATATTGQTAYNGIDIRAALDLSDKFEEKPSVAALQLEALAYMNGNNTPAPSRNIKVDFVRLKDVGEFDQYAELLACNLCDQVRVIFPRYNVSAYFKIVKTEWDVLAGRYTAMELGNLSQSLADALGVGGGSTFGGGSSAPTPADFVTDIGSSTVTNGVWQWREWNSGKVEMWFRGTISLGTSDSAASGVNRRSEYVELPNSYALYDISAQVSGFYSGEWYGVGGFRNASNGSTEPYTKVQVMAYRISTAPVTSAQNVNIYIHGHK